MLDVTATPCGSCMCVPVEVLLPAEIHWDRRELSALLFLVLLSLSGRSRPSWDTRWWPMNWQPVTGASACQFCRPLLRLSPPSTSGDVAIALNVALFTVKCLFFITHHFYWIMLRKHELWGYFWCFNKVCCWKRMRDVCLTKILPASATVSMKKP